MCELPIVWVTIFIISHSIIMTAIGFKLGWDVAIKQIKDIVKNRIEKETLK